MRSSELEVYTTQPKASGNGAQKVTFNKHELIVAFVSLALESIGNNIYSYIIHKCICKRTHLIEQMRTLLHYMGKLYSSRPTTDVHNMLQ